MKTLNKQHGQKKEKYAWKPEKRERYNIINLVTLSKLIVLRQIRKTILIKKPNYLLIIHIILYEICISV